MHSFKLLCLLSSFNVKHDNSLIFLFNGDICLLMGILCVSSLQVKIQECFLIDIHAFTGRGSFVILKFKLRLS